VWQPKAYEGTYGTNGFHLPFSDNSTAAALGTDTSGNSNTWTVNNISVIQGNGNHLKGTITGSPFDASYTWSNAFDGSLAGLGAQSNGGLTYTLTFSTALTGTDFYIYTDQTGNNTNNAFAFNGITATTLNTTQQAGGGPYYKYKLDGISTLASVTTSTVANFLGIEIDGVLLIDNSYSAGNDSLVDSPTNYGTDTGAGGEVRGNYCTLNPLAAGFGSNNQAGTLSNGNLDWTTASTFYFANAVSTIAPKTGKYYVETVCQNASYSGIGFVNAASISSITGNYGLGAPSDGWFRQGTAVNSNNSNLVTGMSALAVGDIVGLALDLDNGKAWWSKNGTWHNSGDPANGTNATVTFTPGSKDWLIGLSLISPASAQSINFGQRPFAYTAPSGFKALCTTNLPEPTIADGSTAMDVVLYTGNGSTQTISGLNFSPDLFGLSRSNAYPSLTLTDC
jgi:hypothetical protein